MIDGLDNFQVQLWPFRATAVVVEPPVVEDADIPTTDQQVGPDMGRMRP